MPDLPTTAADNFFRAVERVTKATAAWVAANAPETTPAQMVLFINQLPMEALIRDTLGFNGDLAELEATQVKLLKNFEVVAPISPGVVQALVDVNQATFLSYVGTMSGTIREELVKAVLAGVPRNQLANHIAAVAGKTLSRGQVKTLVETALKTFTRSVNAVMSEELPANTLYQYIGVTDEKTRPICLVMLDAGPQTKAEFNDKFPGAFLVGGGFNCRHRWAVKTDLSNKFADPAKARAEIDALKAAGKWTPPETLQQQVGA